VEHRGSARCARIAVRRIGEDTKTPGGVKIALLMTVGRGDRQ
jgi:hypothetical protein